VIGKNVATHPDDGGQVRATTTSRRFPLSRVVTIGLEVPMWRMPAHCPMLRSPWVPDGRPPCYRQSLAARTAQLNPERHNFPQTTPSRERPFRAMACRLLSDFRSQAGKRAFPGGIKEP